MKPLFVCSIKTMPLLQKASVYFICFGLTMVMIPLFFSLGLQPFSHMWQNLAVFAAVIIPATVLHEWLHGVFMKKYSGSVQYGGKWTWMGFVFYATSQGAKFTRRQMMIIGLAPQMMTILAVILAVIFRGYNLFSTLMVYTVAYNLGGGSMDIYTVAKLTEFPATVLVEDTKDGFTVWEKDGG